MCGIAGIVSKRGSDDRSNSLGTHAMLKHLLHRGPDQEGVFHNRGVSIGMTRLEIVGSVKTLPYANHDGTVRVVFNGELYNVAELRREVQYQGFPISSSSDGAVLPYLYQMWGDDLFDHLTGMYAMAIYDLNAGRVLLARDRLGIKPLFLFEHAHGYAFSSEIQAFRALPEFQPATNVNAIPHYLQYRFVPAPETILKNVTKVQAGTTVTLSGSNRPDHHRYWSLPAQSPRIHITADQAQDELDALLTEIVQDHSQTHHSAGILLSGGVDSTFLAYLLSQNLVPQAYVLEDDEDSRELAHARLTADQLGLSLKVIPSPNITPTILERVLQQMGEPIGDPTALSLDHVLGHAARHHRVLYSAEGADEVFFGYPHYRHAAWHRYLHPLARLFPVQNGRFWGRVSRPISQGYHGVSGTFWEDDVRLMLLHPDAWSQYQPPIPTHASTVHMMQAVDLTTYLPDDVLIKSDHLSMAYSTELRVPFLDHRLVEWAWQIPTDWFINRQHTKHLFRNVAHRYIPSSIAFREKSGFPTPLSRWLTTEWRDWVGSTLSSSAMATRGLWNMPAIRHRWTAMQQQHGTLSRQIFNILVLEVWLQRMVDGHATTRHAKLLASEWH